LGKPIAALLRGPFAGRASPPPFRPVQKSIGGEEGTKVQIGKEGSRVRLWETKRKGGKKKGAMIFAGKWGGS